MSVDFTQNCGMKNEIHIGGESKVESPSYIYKNQILGKEYEVISPVLNQIHSKSSGFHFFRHFICTLVAVYLLSKYTLTLYCSHFPFEHSYPNI